MNEERIMNIILAPVVSEKSSMIGDYSRQFVFKVLNDATKPEIKKAVEKLFKVEVKHVRVCRMKTKPKRHGRIMGKRNAWKKAYVGLREGFDIDFMTAD